MLASSPGDDSSSSEGLPDEKAERNHRWITISGASTTVWQMGDGDFHINASPNPGSSPRTTKVYADGTVYVVTQAGR
jgi:hypothetical protein